MNSLHSLSRLPVKKVLLKCHENEDTDTGEGKNYGWWIGIRAGVRAKKVAASNEQGGEASGANGSIKTLCGRVYETLRCN